MDIKEIIIDEDYLIKDAIKLLNKTGKKALIVEKFDKLVGTITDGDIRRWILKNGNLDETCNKIMNKNPIVVKESEKSKAIDIMKKKSLNLIPVVNKEEKVISVIFWNDSELYLSNNKLENIPVIIMAGGLGTRLYPYTKILPKPLIPIGDIPIAERIINNFEKFGIEDVFLMLNHKKNMIKSYFNDNTNKYNIEFIEEKKALGTGGSLYMLRNKLKDTFFLTNCDILIDSDYSDIYKIHKENKNIITIVSAMKNVTIPYGVIGLNDEGNIQKISEKPEFSYIVNTGMYLVEPKVLDYIIDDECVDFPEIIDRCRKDDLKVGVYPIPEESWLDMGEIDEMKNMIKKLGIN